jgi:hypothetical protein
MERTSRGLRCTFPTDSLDWVRGAACWGLAVPASVETVWHDLIGEVWPWTTRLAMVRHCGDPSLTPSMPACRTISFSSLVTGVSTLKHSSCNQTAEMLLTAPQVRGHSDQDDKCPAALLCQHGFRRFGFQNRLIARLPMFTTHSMSFRPLHLQHTSSAIMTVSLHPTSCRCQPSMGLRKRGELKVGVPEGQADRGLAQACQACSLPCQKDCRIASG